MNNKNVNNLYYILGIIFIVIGFVLSFISLFIVNKYCNKFVEVIGILLIGAGPALIIGYYLQKSTFEENQKIIKDLEGNNKLLSDDNVILRSNVESIVQSGILNVFKNRKKDDDRLKKAIDGAANISSKINLMGVAFPSLLDINLPHTKLIEEKLKDPHILIRILLLNPDSNAARRRERIEDESTTIADINKSLETSIRSWAKIRINIIREAQGNNSLDEGQLRNNSNIEVKIYDFDPIMLLMIFDDSLFVEQYHFGRPDSVDLGCCIGKWVPVIQFKRNSLAYDFFKCHFEYVWDNYSKPYDIFKPKNDQKMSHL